MIEPPPRSFISGAACLIARNGPIRLTRRISCQSSGDLLEDRGEAAGNAGIGEEDVEPADVAVARARPGRHVLLVAGVGGDADRAFELRHAEVGGDHVRALAREQGRGGLADARRRAGDDRDLAFQPHSPTPIVLPPSTIDRLAGHEGGGARGEEHGGAGDLVRLADPLHRRVTLVTRFSVSGFSHSARAKSVGPGPARCS